MVLLEAVAHALGARIGGRCVVTWAVSATPRRPGDLLTAGDLAHVGPDRDGAERAGAALGGAPDLLRLEKRSARVWRVLWSLSDTSRGQLRTAPSDVRTAPVGPLNAPRLTDG